MTISYRTMPNGRITFNIILDGVLTGYSIYINTNFSNIINNTLEIKYCGILYGKSLKDLKKLCELRDCKQEFDTIRNLYYELKYLNNERWLKGYAH